MSRWEESISSAEAEMEYRRKLAAQAADYCDTVRHIASLVEHSDGMPTKPILEAKEIALEEAYEAILLWRSAREEYRRRLGASGARVPQAAEAGAQGKQAGG